VAVWVIKLGGSLLGTDELQHWLRIIAQHGDGRVVIVPGGGVFADTVRTLYAQVPMSDSCAHALAVSAMNQFGTLLIDQMPALVPAHSELEIAERSWQHRGIVWMPSKMVMTDGDDIPHSWDVTSDSLALWLANKISAKHVLLIKSKRPQKNAMLSDLMQEGLIDPAYSLFDKGSEVKTWVVYKSDYQAFLDGFNEASLMRVGHLIQ
jgi:5-(aminomethyl)-3-furanmethanol phosphate kinase